RRWPRCGNRGGACAPGVSYGCERPRIHLSWEASTKNPRAAAAAGRRGSRPSLTPSSLVLFPFLLALLGALLGALAVPGADLGLHDLRPGLEGARLAQPGHHLHALPDAHLGHLPHEGAHLLELAEELLDLVRLDARAAGDAPPAAEVDDVGV